MSTNARAQRLEARRRAGGGELGHRDGVAGVGAEARVGSSAALARVSPELSLVTDHEGDASLQGKAGLLAQPNNQLIVAHRSDSFVEDLETGVLVLGLHEGCEEDVAEVPEGCIAKMSTSEIDEWDALMLSNFALENQLHTARQKLKMANECCSIQLIDGDGVFNVTSLEHFMKSVKLAEHGFSYAVVSIMGPQSSGMSLSFLNSIFVFYVLEGYVYYKDDTVFEKQSALFALAVSDIVLINMWCYDIGQEQVANKPLLKTVFQVMLRLFSPRKTTLLFVIRDKTRELRSAGSRAKDATSEKDDTGRESTDLVCPKDERVAEEYTGGREELLNELASKKILVQHLETVGHSQSVKDVLHSFLDLTRSSRFEQIWKKRGSIDEEEYSLHEKCHLYDVVRVDAEDETHQRVPKAKDAPDVDGAMLDKFLPLLREFLPQAVEEIEHYKATTEDNFVYDIYTHEVGVDTDTDNTDEYPLVQVYMEDDYDDGLSQSDYESDDSNAENNPWNDYCDEETSEDEDEIESAFTHFEDSDSNYEQEVASKEDDLENWRWDYR
ncbi:hypothetical protein ZIOFF_073388 [Zingiber officinale]|uniref:Uncharacterized protein n=1 Tax=Zingiber officinale TaxID=94328 RepID=A0A8J5C7B4_ZINOF|nr:hypothetical protein ZIOFF_073388 [Zingiber officinale]